MNKLLSLVFTLVAVSCAACAGETPGDAAGQIHVDIDRLVAAGEVVPVDGITSAGQPDAAALRVFADSGYKVIVDMRGPDEDRGLEDERGAVESLGMDYIAFPISDAGDINFETARKLDELLQDVEGPVLLHCASGNRVGAVLALRHRLTGASPEESIEHGRNAGLTRLEGEVRDRLESE
ncbi:MAG: sulfur transferase domain-containing protein [Gammaproteobacteria bacterium]|nr:sulfur transferase domain-containing protein [Gammaproteobacteria bacterium]MDH3434405.1 sulfur transferase domain-containing protein [Gammaproteobacteria bacterium]